MPSLFTKIPPPPNPYAIDAPLERGGLFLALNVKPIPQFYEGPRIARPELGTQTNYTEGSHRILRNFGGGLAWPFQGHNMVPSAWGDSPQTRMQKRGRIFRTFFVAP